MDTPERLPIKLDPTSNGEFEPVPLAPVERQANVHAWETVNDAAKHVGRSASSDSGDFLSSVMPRSFELAARNTVPCRRLTVALTGVDYD